MPVSAPPIPSPVQRALRKLASDLRGARLRRHIPTQVMADRIMVSRTTLYRLEKGDPNVSMGTYVTALYVLGLLDRIEVLADIGDDELGKQLSEEALPKRIRS